MKKLLFCILILLFSSLANAASTEDRLFFDKDNVKIDFVIPISQKFNINEDIKLQRKQIVENFISSLQDSDASIASELIANCTPNLINGLTYSLVWEVYVFTGGAHGLTTILTSIYDYKTTNKIEPLAMFKNRQKAIELMSEISRQRLPEQIDLYNKEMLMDGTEPVAENFSSFVPTKDGIKLFFQAYQVAPYASGIQTLEIPLEDLKEANPYYSYWK